MSKQPPPAPIASTIGPCPTIIQISRTPWHWKFTQHLRTTRPPPSLSGLLMINASKTRDVNVKEALPKTYSVERITEKKQTAWVRNLYMGTALLFFSNLNIFCDTNAALNNVSFQNRVNSLKEYAPRRVNWCQENKNENDRFDPHSN